MDDWFGVVAIVVVCGGVGVLQVAILRLTRPTGRAHSLHASAACGLAPEDEEEAAS